MEGLSPHNPLRHSLYNNLTKRQAFSKRSLTPTDSTKLKRGYNNLSRHRCRYNRWYPSTITKRLHSRYNHKCLYNTLRHKYLYSTSLYR